MFKKYMAMFMACAIALTLSVPMVAFAAGNSGEKASADEITSADNKGSSTITMKYTSVTQIPVLQIKIANKAGLILNPYKLKYESGGRMDFVDSTDFMFDASSGNVKTDSSNGTTYRQIISSPMVIESKTEVPVLVGASVSTTVSPGVSLKATNITYVPSGKTQPDSGKMVYMWLAADASVAADANAADAEIAVVSRALALNPTDNAAKTIVLSATGGKVAAAENKSIVTIPAVTEDMETQYAAFVFNGEMVVSPKTGTNNTPWTTDDKVTPTVTLSLSILENDWSSELSADNAGS